MVRTNIDSAVTHVDDTYNLRGINTVLPDQILPDGQSPFTINSRMYARDIREKRVAIKSRAGTERYSTALGEAIAAQNVATAVGILDITADKRRATKFTQTAAGVLTRLDIEIENIAVGVGYVRIEVYTDNAGALGQLVGETSIVPNQITGTFAYLPVYLIDAPDAAVGTDYWIVAYIQDNGSGTYNLRSTAGTGLISSDDGATWVSAGANSAFRFKSYVATAGGVKGWIRRYPSTGASATLIAAGVNIISVSNTGVPTIIDSSINPVSREVIFAHLQDRTIWVDGYGNARYTDDGVTVKDLPNAPTGASNVIVYAGRVFFVLEKTLVKFSELYDTESYPSVNFFYVPDPKNQDPLIGWAGFQSTLLIFTHETKQTIRGTNISDFQRDEAVGTKGAVSQKAIAVDKDGVYFMADDGMIYFYNGINDILVSDAIQTELSSILDKNKVSIYLYQNMLKVYYAKSGEPYPTHIAVLDLINSNFSKRDFQWFLDTGKPVVGATELFLDDNQLIEFSSKAAWLFTAESECKSDLGKPIDFKYWTAYKHYNYSTSKKKVRKFHPLVHPSDMDYYLLVGRDFDFLDKPTMRQYLVSAKSPKWGAFVWADGTVYRRLQQVTKDPSTISGRGRHVQFRFEGRLVGVDVNIYGYTALVKEGIAK